MWCRKYNAEQGVAFFAQSESVCCGVDGDREALVGLDAEPERTEDKEGDPDLTGER